MEPAAWQDSTTWAGEEAAVGLETAIAALMIATETAIGIVTGTETVIAIGTETVIVIETETAIETETEGLAIAIETKTRTERRTDPERARVAGSAAEAETKAAVYRRVFWLSK